MELVNYLVNQIVGRDATYRSDFDMKDMRLVVNVDIQLRTFLFYQFKYLDPAVICICDEDLSLAVDAQLRRVV